jgi:hypothetical protein
MIRENANDPRVRAAAIQTTIGYLKRRAADGAPLFRINPRFVVVGEHDRADVPVLQQLLEGGYCYDPKRSYTGAQFHGIRPPRKDGYYEHPANCLEYLTTVFAPPDAAAQAGIIRNDAAARDARRLLRDHGKDDSAAAVTALAGRIQQARIDAHQRRLEQQREREALKRLRAAQRDPDEPFRWPNRGPNGGGRGGYSGAVRGGYRR